MVKNPPAEAGDVGDPRSTGLIPWVEKIPLRREWQPTPVFLPGESCGQRSLAGCRPWGRKESDTTVHTADSTQSLEGALGLKPGRTTRPSTRPPQGDAESQKARGHFLQTGQGPSRGSKRFRVSRIPFIPRTPTLCCGSSASPAPLQGSRAGEGWLTSRLPSPCPGKTPTAFLVCQALWRAHDATAAPIQ